MSLDNLPSDLVKHIAGFLGLFDSIFLSQTSKHNRLAVSSLVISPTISFEDYVRVAWQTVCQHCKTACCCCYRGVCIGRKTLCEMGFADEMFDKAENHALSFVSNAEIGFSSDPDHFCVVPKLAAYDVMCSDPNGGELVCLNRATASRKEEYDEDFLDTRCDRMFDIDRTISFPLPYNENSRYLREVDEKDGCFQFVGLDQDLIDFLTHMVNIPTKHSIYCSAMPNNLSFECIHDKLRNATQIYQNMSTMMQTQRRSGLSLLDFISQH